MSPQWPHGALISGLLLALLAGTAASTPNKLDARARAALVRLQAGGASIEAMRGGGAAVDRDGGVSVFIHGSVTRAQLEAAGARVRTALPDLFTASIPAGAMAAVAALEGVTAIRGGAPCEPELNVSRPTTGVSLLRGPGPAFAGLNGQGVLVGIVDSGVDYDHGDFRDSTGATRIINIWDQLEPGLGPPGMPYPYGKEWTQSQINSATSTQVDVLEHGTHVAGIAAGDGSQTGAAIPAFTHAGMAPRSDLIVVKTDFLTPDVIDGVNYVFDKATTRGQNAVVNLSLGSHFGSHDGLSAFEQALTALSGPGRIVVKSAGNDRGKAVHAQVNATAGGASVTLSVTGSATDRYFAVDGYYSAGERLRVRVQTPNGTVIGPMVVKTENAPWPGQTTQNGDVYVAHDSLDTVRKNVYIEVNVIGNKNMNGTWTITLFADQLGPPNGEVDLWRYLAASGVTANFVTGNLSTQELVTEPGNATDVVTVGAWVTKTSWTGCNGVVSTYAGTPAVGNLALFSSPGPTRDGRQKPDLVAPGTAIGATRSFDVALSCPAAPATTELLNDSTNHRILQGTSVSAPHVTGAVALLLQKSGAMTPQQVITYLRSHARSDAFTGIVPTKDWGYGKLDLGDLIDPVVRVLSPNGGEVFMLGENPQLTWTATDSLGGVTAVDLLLSRSGSTGPFETIATGVANTGSYGWTVTGPTPVFSNGYLRVLAYDTNGNIGSDLSDSGFTVSGPVAVGDEDPTGFSLGSTSPNPTRGSIEVRFSVARESHVRVSVCDIQGRTVTVLANGVYSAGRHQATWESARSRTPTPAGLYFLRYETIEGSFVRRIAVTR